MKSNIQSKHTMKLVLVAATSIIVLIGFTVFLSNSAAAQSQQGIDEVGAGPEIISSSKATTQGLNPLFLSETNIHSYVSHIFTVADVIFFSYKDGTIVALYDSTGALIWNNNDNPLNKGEHAHVVVSQGVYTAKASEKFAILSGDPVTGYVVGYYAMDQDGYGASTELYTWVPHIYGHCSFIVFAYKDDTQVTVENTDTGIDIATFTLNKGEHWQIETLDTEWLHITSNNPVSALTAYDQGYFVPSANGKWSGTEFYTYVSDIWNWPEDLTVMAYNDSTSVTIKDSDTGIVIWSGILNSGEAHVERYPNGADKFFTITSSKTVTVSVQPWVSMTSSYHQGAYVADSTGTMLGTDLIGSTLNGGYLYILAYRDNTNVVVYNSQTGAFIKSYTLNEGDYVEANPGNGLWRIMSNYPVSAYSGWGYWNAEFARAPGTSDYAHNTFVDFGGVTAKNVRLTANSNWGGMFNQYGLSEVRFFSIPVFAREPSPDSGTTDVDVDVTLSFRAGREAAKHDVYLSTDEQAVIDGTADVTTVTEASHGPLPLDLGTTYYWKINEVNEVETTTTWQGDIWNFTTHEYFVVDDFEDYNDYPPDEIWSTWIDGYGILTNGATVGYPAPDWNQDEHYVETAIVHGGEQAMPFFYDNTGSAAYSEGERTFAVPQDWTKHGIKALTLYFHGDPNNAAEQMYVKLNGSKVTYDGDAANLTQTAWQPWNIDLVGFTGVNLSNVTELSIGLERIGAAGGKGVVYFDDIRLYPLFSAVVGTFSIHPWTGDGDSGISSSKTYTHTGKFTGEGTDGEPFFAGNGVYFERDTNRSGTSWTLTGAANVFGTTNPVTVADDSAALARSFFYGDEDNNHPVLTLMGLLPNTEYVTTFYTVGFGGAGLRFVDITPGDNLGYPTRVDQNGVGSGSGQLIKHTYTATSTEMSFMFDALKTGDSWHHYAFSNEAVSPNLGSN